jgi:hypothetical protein
MVPRDGSPYRKSTALAARGHVSRPGKIENVAVADKTAAAARAGPSVVFAEEVRITLARRHAGGM